MFRTVVISYTNLYFLIRIEAFRRDVGFGWSFEKSKKNFGVAEDKT